MSGSHLSVDSTAPIQATFYRILQPLVAFGVLATVALTTGCQEQPEITTYTIPTKMPAQLKAGRERIVAVMAPLDNETWFFKIKGPENAIETVVEQFKEFVAGIKFEDGNPLLDDLPEGWRSGGGSAMRFASINIETPNKQLDLSVSKLGQQGDWDDYVKMNVNRWRGQVGLDASEEKWAAADAFEMENIDGPAVWVDIAGEASDGAAPMAPFAGMAGGGMPAPMVTPNAESAPSSTKPSPAAEPKVEFDRPEGWRDGRMSMMRMAAFNVGPEDEDKQAEVTVITAGGDLRGNVARWLGQVRGGAAPDDVVDQIMADAEKVTVDGKEGTRYLLTQEDPSEGTAIDATIVPLESGMSLFIKMTGPADTVQDQGEKLGQFIESLKL